MTAKAIGRLIDRHSRNLADWRSRSGPASELLFALRNSGADLFEALNEPFRKSRAMAEARRMADVVLDQSAEIMLRVRRESRDSTT